MTPDELQVQGPHELENEIFGIVDSDRIDCTGLGWTSGIGTASPADSPAGAAKPRSAFPGVCARHGSARRNRAAAGSEWRLHHRADPPPGSGDDGPGLDAWQRR